VIEDDAELRSALVSGLRAEGYLVVGVSDGEQVLKWWPELSQGVGPVHVDLIVTDQRMPKVSGLEVLQAVRQIDWATQVVLISAFADDDLRREAKRLGAAAVLSKPFTMDRLLDTVKQVAPA
jgi:CheY-like chemotaxis protein